MLNKLTASTLKVVFPGDNIECKPNRTFKANFAKLSLKIIVMWQPQSFENLKII